MSNDIVEFDIHVKMERRWVNDFCSMLKEMERNSKVGRSGWIGLYADGDGDFRARFDIETEWEKTHSLEFNSDTSIIVLTGFDAG